jgi:hypothetical protein
VNTVQAFLMPGVLPEVALSQAMAVLEADGYRLPDGIRLETGGDSDARNSTVQALSRRWASSSRCRSRWW